MKKVCIISLYGYSLFEPTSKDGPIGGSEIQLHMLSKELSKDDQYLVSCAVGDFNQPTLELYGRITLHKSFSVSKTTWNYMISPFKLWKCLMKTKSEVFIASSAGAEIGIISFYCRLLGKKFIFRTASSVDCNGEKIKQLGLVRGKLYKFGLLNANTVIVQSQRDQDALLQTHNKPSVIIKNSFPITHFHINKPRKHIMWVGSSRKVKRPELFLRLARTIPSEQFVMILSKSDPDLWHKIQQESSLIDNLKFIGGIPFAETRDYFETSKLLVGTSEYEGFPNVYIQACLANVPIISLVANPDNFITDNKIGYCAENDFERLVKQTKQLLSEPATQQSMSQNAYNYALNNHSIEKNIKTWKQIISF